MTILAVGDEPEFFSNFFSGANTVHTLFKDDGQRGGIYSNATNIWFLDLPAGVSELWMRFHTTRSPSTSTTNPILTFTNTSTGKDAFRVMGTPSADTWRMTYNSVGTTYTTLADAPFPSGDGTVTHEVVLYFKRGASGVLRLWIDDDLLIDITGTYNTVDTTWNRIRFAGVSTSTTTTLSHGFGGIVVADEPLYGFIVDHLSPSAAGTYSAWTGSYTALADTTNAPQVDTSTFITTNANGQKFSAAYEDTVALDGSREVACVAIAMRGIREAGSTPTGASFLSRHAGTDYTLNNLSLGGSDSSFTQILATDPAGGAWTESSVNAIEFGVTT